MNGNLQKIKNEEALCWAAQKGHLNVVKYLVNQGVDIHADNDYVLHLAALASRLDVVEYLKNYKK